MGILGGNWIGMMETLTLIYSPRICPEETEAFNPLPHHGFNRPHSC